MFLPTSKQVLEYLEVMNPQPGNPNGHQVDLVLMSVRELMPLEGCAQAHGAPHNTASVYAHHGSRRICIRLHDTDEWVYDPGWEK